MLILEYFSLKNIGKQENKKKGYFKKFKLLNLLYYLPKSILDLNRRITNYLNELSAGIEQLTLFGG